MDPDSDEVAAVKKVRDVGEEREERRTEREREESRGEEWEERGNKSSDPASDEVIAVKYAKCERTEERGERRKVTQQHQQQ